MKRFLAISATALLLAVGLAPASAATKYSVNQKTLATFGSSATGLTSMQKAQVKATVEANPNAEKFICTGVRYYSQPMSVNIMVRKRAKAACEYAKQLNPSLSTWYQNKPTQARSYAGKVLLTVKSPDVSQVVMNLDSYNPSQVAIKAQSQVDSFLAAQTTSNKYELIVGANVSAADSVREIERLSKSLRFWNFIYTNKPKIVFYSGADSEWAASQLDADGFPGLGDLIRSGSDDSTGCTQSLAYVNFFYHCIGENQSSVRMSPIGAHEYAHMPLVQQFLKQPVVDANSTPTWSNEGGAEFFALALTDEAGYADSPNFYKVHLNQLRQVSYKNTLGETTNIKQAMPKISSVETAALMASLETQSAMSSSAPYSLGKWATELLIAVYGLDSYFDFLKGMNATTDWKGSFEESFGVTTLEFYGHMDTYLNWIGGTYY
jgi:hypothetical protein